jgi:hypothetical protein
MRRFGYCSISFESFQQSAISGQMLTLVARAEQKRELFRAFLVTLLCETNPGFLRLLQTWDSFLKTNGVKAFVLAGRQGNGSGFRAICF